MKIFTKLFYQTRKINLANPRHQFVIALSTNLIFFIFLYCHPIANWNLHPPEGTYVDNMLTRGDVPSYLRPARNFVKFGIFGDGFIPDYFRTIGYPAFLSGLMLLFGEYFFWLVYLIQAVLSALTFSMITAIANFFVGNDQRINKMTFIFLWLSGAYWIYFPMMMTEVLFCFFLITGIYYGIKAISEKSWQYCIIHSLFLCYAASVRPSLTLYILPEFFILLYLASYFKTIVERKVKIMIGVASILVFFLTSLSGFRNYINYGSLQQSSVLSINLYDEFAFKVLQRSHQETNSFLREQGFITKKEKTDPVGTSLIRSKRAFEIIKLHPEKTILTLIENFFENLFYPHYRWVTTITGKLVTQEKLDVYNINSIINKIKEIGIPIFLMGLFFMLLYPFVWLLTIKHILRKFKEKEYLYLLAVLSFLAYLFIPTILAPVAGRIRLPVEWLMVLLAAIEFYYLWDKYKLRIRSKVVHGVKLND